MNNRAKILILLEFFSLFLTISKAYAGGSRPSEIPPAEGINSNSAVLNILDWNKWNNPYWLNGYICRTYNANLICLTPEAAKNLRWFIESDVNSNKRTTIIKR